jgi:oligogalacturonide lyase
MRLADSTTGSTTSKVFVIWPSSYSNKSALALFFLAVASASGTDKPELASSWVDPDTGHRIMRLSRVPGESTSLYFHQNEFTASGDKLVFENAGGDRSHTGPGRWGSRIYVYDFATDKSELLTDDGGKVILVAAKSRQVYHQRSNAVFATSVDTHETKTLVQLPSRWRISAINADETLGAGTFVAGGPQIDTSGPKSSWFDKIYEAARPGGIFLVNLKNGETNVVRRGTDWFNHLQFSPTDTSLLMFCHEGPWHKVDRIWQIRTDGTRLYLVHARTMSMEIAGHEFWSHDGKAAWFDLQMPRGQKFFLAGAPVGDDVKHPSNIPASEAATIRTAAVPSSPLADEIRYPITRDQWSVHYNVSWDGKLFAGDGGDSGMVAHAGNGKWIYLFTPQTGGSLKAEKLVNMAKHNYHLEPNVQFKPDGKWIIFRANFEGTSQVYGVEVAKAEVHPKAQ